MRSSSLALLRRSILAAAGLGVAGCGTGAAKTGHGGAGGTATASTSTTSASATTSGHGGAGGASATSGHGGAGGTGGAATTGTGGTGGTIADPLCAGAKIVPTNSGAPSGFVECPDGTVHRAQATACDPTIDAPVCTGMEQTVTCASDADCTAGPHGRCVSLATLDDDGVHTACSCAYSCSTDADCNPGDAGAADAGDGGPALGNVCVCGGVVAKDTDWSFCTPAACATGADCASGECGLSAYYNGCVWDIELQCRNPGDACRSEADCATDGGLHKTCVFPADSAWQCKGWTCVRGRPLVVAGEARTAPAAARDDWSAPAAPDLAGLDAPTRARLADHWLEVAAAEHASVASFARFTLELCALGAPAALVAEAQRAGLDEVDHARLAYGLASAYAGRALGPGPLALGKLEVAADRAQMVRSLVEEACVGETLGVAEALAFAEAARDPVVERIHRRIAADEQRHAELAWRTLAWLLDGAGEPLRREAATAFEAAVRRAQGDDALAAVRRQAIREVIAPCAAALLDAHRAPAADGPSRSWAST
jgi:hypothetical protein